MNTNGRKICDELKRIRCEVAKANDINYQPTICHYQGECNGTCPQCEAELAELTRLINAKKDAKIVGIAPLKTVAIAAGMTMAMASCGNKNNNFYNTTATEGEICRPSTEVAPPAPHPEPTPKYYDIDPEEVPPTQSDGISVKLLKYSNDPVSADSVASSRDDKPQPQLDLAAIEVGKMLPNQGLVDTISPSSAVDEADQEEIIRYIEKRASFPGGKEELKTWISLNLRYPKECIDVCVVGVVVVRFVVEKDGSITNAEVIRSVDSRLDAEAIRLVKSMPKWIPGEQSGKVVRSYYRLPIRFAL